VLPTAPRYAVAITVVDWGVGGVGGGEGRYGGIGEGVGSGDDGVAAGGARSNEPRVLMVKRGTEPAKGQW
jgi:hypothetical protein